MERSESEAEEREPRGAQRTHVGQLLARVDRSLTRLQQFYSLAQPRRPLRRRKCEHKIEPLRRRHLESRPYRLGDATSDGRGLGR